MNDDSPARRDVLIGAGALIAFPSETALAEPAGSGSADFDFLHGRWKVVHRKLAKRLAGSDSWFRFPGTLHVRSILGGLGNIDENLLLDPGGTYSATSIRVFDPKASTWSIYWADARFGGLDAPVVGRFEGRIGRFYNDDSLDGRPIRVRTTYEHVDSGRAQWTQAFSLDRGTTWETNWIMDFHRQTGE